jgi:uncharacterized membrane protein YhhN
MWHPYRALAFGYVTDALLMMQRRQFFSSMLSCLFLARLPL